MDELLDNDGEALTRLLQLDAAWAAVSRVFNQALRESGLSLPQALAVLRIATEPQPLLLSGLAERLIQEAQSVTSLADRLEQAGLARRVKDLPDRRAIRFELTEAGQEKAAALRPVLETAAAQVAQTLKQSEWKHLRRALDGVYAACRAMPGVKLPELPDRSAD